MALITLAEVDAVVADGRVTTYIANRPVLFAELSAAAAKAERLNADQFGNEIGVVPPVAVPPSVA